MTEEIRRTRKLLNELSSGIIPGIPRIGIVLAAGHGKRIRSERSKMLHQIWGKPTVTRVADAVEKGLESPNQIIVVGIKGAEVARAAGERPGRIFAYQENPVLGRPAGTGDAVRVALESLPDRGENREIYIFLGDMGLLTGKVVEQFRRSFESRPCDMMVLTGTYRGPSEQNYYGRIVRVPAVHRSGHPSGEDEGKVIEINFDGCVRRVTAKDGAAITIDPPLPAAPVKCWLVADWGANRNFALDLRLRSAAESKAPAPGSNIDIPAYRRGDFDGDGRRDVPAYPHDWGRDARMSPTRPAVHP